MGHTHTDRALSAARIRWIALVTVSALLAVAALPLAAPVDAHEAQQQATELGGVRVSDNEPVAPAGIGPVLGRLAGGIGANPADPDHMVGFAYEVYANVCEHYTTFDGGETWSIGSLATPEGFGGDGGYCSIVRSGPNATHGPVAWGSGDNVYTATAAFRDGRLGQSVLVARSTDGGVTFGTPVEAMEGGTDEAAALPNYSFTRVGVEARAGLPDRVYAQGRAAGNDVVVAVSEDAGETWSAPVAVNRVADEEHTGTEASQIVIGADEGEAYFAWRSVGNAGEIRIGRTLDGGQTWTSHHVTDVRAFSDLTTNWPGSAYPRLAIAPDGTLYLVYQEGPPRPVVEPMASSVTPQDHFIHPDSDVILLSSSTDGGETWTAATTVNDEPPANDGNVYHQIRHPNIAVAPNGRVDIVWHDRRHWIEGKSFLPSALSRRPINVCSDSHADCDEARLGDTYYAFSTDGGATFSTDLRISDVSQNNDVGWDYRIGAYWHNGMDLTHAGNDLVVAWGDSRRGNWHNDNHDIYFTRVSHGNSATAPLPLRSVPAATPADLSVELAQIGYPGGLEATLSGNLTTEAWSKVVLVNEGDWAAALVGGVLARHRMAPVLATGASGMSPAVSAEVNRMDPVGAYILGSPQAVSSGIASNLEGRGIPVTRFGETPAAMAAAVAHELDLRTDEQMDAGEPAFDAVVIVNPANPDSAAASVLAANRQLPVLFVDSDSIPSATQTALNDLDIEQALVVGGTAAVSDPVLAQLPSPQRLTGADVYATSVAIVEESVARGLPTNIVYVADGDDPMHAALAGSAVARAGGLLLLAPGADPDEATARLSALGLRHHAKRLVLLASAAVACAPDEVVDAPLLDRDLIPEVHRLNVDCAHGAGIVTGFEDGTFGPTLRVRRDQMASFIARSLDAAGVELPAASTDRFSDVAVGSAHDDNIHRLAAAEIVLGGPGGLPADQYGPSLGVRRDQMASFLLRAAEYATDQQLASQTAAFPDVASGNTHFGSVNGASELGLAQGFADGTFRPGAGVRRDQMATFVTRLYTHLLEGSLAAVD